MPRRLYMIWTNPIFRDVVRLILDHPEVQWLGTSSNFVTALETIQMLQPDTIVVENVESRSPVELIDLLETAKAIVRVFYVSLDDNRLHIYAHENWSVGEADDLLRLIL